MRSLKSTAFDIERAQAALGTQLVHTSTITESFAIIAFRQRHKKSSFAKLIKTFEDDVPSSDHRRQRIILGYMEQKASTQAQLRTVIEMAAASIGPCRVPLALMKWAQLFPKQK
jgi:hypothetical protein